MEEKIIEIAQESAWLGLCRRHHVEFSRRGGNPVDSVKTVSSMRQRMCCCSSPSDD